MATPRQPPGIWVTSLSKLLGGDNNCEWSAWFMAHFAQWDHVPDTFDQPKWRMEHTALVSEIAEKLGPLGYAVATERQNSFDLPGPATGIVLSGRPDIIATKGTSGLIVDAKTGQPRTADWVQVLIYMWAVPIVFARYRGVTFDGRVVYKDGNKAKIVASELDDTFKERLFAMIRRIGGPEPSKKVPSFSECRFCKIAQSECPERVMLVPVELPQDFDGF